MCMSTSAGLFIRNYVRYTSRKRFVHIVKLWIFFFNWTCSCCVLFVLYDGNDPKTNSSASLYPFTVVGLTWPDINSINKINIEENYTVTSRMLSK